MCLWDSLAAYFEARAITTPVKRNGADHPHPARIVGLFSLLHSSRDFRVVFDTLKARVSWAIGTLLRHRCTQRSVFHNHARPSRESGTAPDYGTLRMQKLLIIIFDICFYR